MIAFAVASYPFRRRLKVVKVSASAAVFFHVQRRWWMDTRVGVRLELGLALLPRYMSAEGSPGIVVQSPKEQVNSAATHREKQSARPFPDRASASSITQDPGAEGLRTGPDSKQLGSSLEEEGCLRLRIGGRG